MIFFPFDHRITPPQQYYVCHQFPDELNHFIVVILLCAALAIKIPDTVSNQYNLDLSMLKHIITTNTHASKSTSMYHSVNMSHMIELQHLGNASAMLRHVPCSGATHTFCVTAIHICAPSKVIVP